MSDDLLSSHSGQNLPEFRTDLSAASEQIPSFLDYLEILARRWKIIIGVSLIVSIITAVYSLFLPNIYTAKAMILPGDDDKGMMSAMLAQMGGLAAMAGGLGGPTKTDLYVTMLKSETVKDPIIDRFKLMKVYEAKFRADAYRALDRNVVISAGKKDGVLFISVDDKDPKRAAEIANTYVEELGKLASGLNMTGAGKNRAFLEERLAMAKTDLVKAEDAIKAFQSKNKVLDVRGQATASLQGVSELRSRLAAQEVLLATLQQQFTDSSHEVISTRAGIANIKRQIANFENSNTSSSIPSFSAVPQLGQEYVRLLREFKIQETLVELLTKQYEMVKINEVKDVSPFQILQKAKVPEKKSKPARSVKVLSALLLSFIGSIVFVFTLEYIEHADEQTKKRLKKILKRST